MRHWYLTNKETESQKWSDLFMPHSKLFVELEWEDSSVWTSKLDMSPVCHAASFFSSSFWNHTFLTPLPQTPLTPPSPSSLWNCSLWHGLHCESICIVFSCVCAHQCCASRSGLWASSETQGKDVGSWLDFTVIREKSQKIAKTLTQGPLWWWKRSFEMLLKPIWNNRKTPFRHKSFCLVCLSKLHNGLVKGNSTLVKKYKASFLRPGFCWMSCHWNVVRGTVTSKHSWRQNYVKWW